LDSILVGGIPTPLKILVTWDDYSQYMENIKMFETTNQHIFKSYSNPYIPSGARFSNFYLGKGIDLK
jgi:hypothetical protein